MKILKKVIAAYIAFFTVGLLFYLIGCFVNHDFNISKWSEVSMGFISMIGGMISFMAAGVTFAHFDEL